ncbi:MAG: ATP-binding protein [Phycisphaerae bacterium]|nr:ATP-binding protein [Phycisphaerae bacterium]
MRFATKIFIVSLSVAVPLVVVCIWSSLRSSAWLDLVQQEISAAESPALAAERVRIATLDCRRYESDILMGVERRERLEAVYSHWRASFDRASIAIDEAAEQGVSSARTGEWRTWLAAYGQGVDATYAGIVDGSLATANAADAVLEKSKGFARELMWSAAGESHNLRLAAAQLSQASFSSARRDQDSAILAGLAAAVAAIVGASAFALRIGARLQQLAAEAERLGADANDGSPRRGSDEIATVAMGLRDMHSRVRARETDLERRHAEARQLANAIDLSDRVVAIADVRGMLTWCSRAFATQLGRGAEQINGLPLLDLLSSAEDDVEAMATLKRSMQNGEACSVDSESVGRDGRRRWAQIDSYPVRGPDRTITHHVVIQTDITERKRSAARRDGAAAVLTMIAGDAPLEAVLDTLVRHMEVQRPGLFASALLLDGDRLRIGAAPSIPASFSACVDGLTIGPDAGACGSACFTGRPVMVASIATDPLFSGWREVMAAFAFRACWSQPILASTGEVLGTLALYAMAERLPTRDDQRLLDESAKLAALAIERRRSDERLQQTIHALTAAKSDAERLRAQADTANEAKSTFLAQMSHEIRVPLTAILGFTDLLEEPLPQQQRHECAVVVRRSGAHLLSVINDVLDLAKIEAGVLRVLRTPCDPRRVLSDVIALMRQPAGDKKIDLRFIGADVLPAQIVTDATRLRQIVTNLLGNAIAGTDTASGPSTIEVRASIVPHTNGTESSSILRIEVQDEGIGIARDDLCRVFHAFERTAASMAGGGVGTGLGLTISQRLAELLGGEITLVSEVGHGSTFTLTIDAGDTSGEITMLPVDADSNDEAPLEALDGRILLAEDQLDNQRLFQIQLTSAGAVVDVASDGAQALRAVGRAIENGTPYDLIILDAQMPVTDGYTAARQLRAQGYAAPIVALTAHALPSERQRALDAGCDDYATKPIERATLISLAARWIRVARAKQRARCRV